MVSCRHRLSTYSAFIIQIVCLHNSIEYRCTSQVHSVFRQIDCVVEVKINLRLHREIAITTNNVASLILSSHMVCMRMRIFNITLPKCLSIGIYFNSLQVSHTASYEQYICERFVVACTTHREQLWRVMFCKGVNSVDDDHR